MQAGVLLNSAGEKTTCTQRLDLGFILTAETIHLPLYLLELDQTFPFLLCPTCVLLIPVYLHLPPAASNTSYRQRSV